MQPDRPPRVHILGADVDLVTPDEVMAFLAERAAVGAPAVIANHNAHSLALFQRSERVRAFFDMADLIEIDSRPLIAWGRRLGLPTRPEHRCTYLDWSEQFWRMASDKGWRVFYLGGAPGVPDRAAARLAVRWPGVKLAWRHGYFDASPGSAENRAIVERIVEFEPDVILVGMGMPRQEAWILANRAAIPKGVMLSVGAAFDYEAGAQAAAPRWMGAAGLEWLFRLATQPRRLAWRYLVEPWTLAPVALEDLRAARRRRAGETAPLEPALT